MENFILVTFVIFTLIITMQPDMAGDRALVVATAVAAVIWAAMWRIRSMPLKRLLCDRVAFVVVVTIGLVTLAVWLHVNFGIEVVVMGLLFLIGGFSMTAISKRRVERLEQSK